MTGGTYGDRNPAEVVAQGTGLDVEYIGIYIIGVA